MGARFAVHILSDRSIALSSSIRVLAYSGIAHDLPNRAIPSTRYYSRSTIPRVQIFPILYRIPSRLYNSCAEPRSWIILHIYKLYAELRAIARNLYLPYPCLNHRDKIAKAEYP